MNIYTWSIVGIILYKSAILTRKICIILDKDCPWLISYITYESCISERCFAICHEKSWATFKSSVIKELNVFDYNLRWSLAFMSYYSWICNSIKSDFGVFNFYFRIITIDCCLLICIIIKELGVLYDTASKFRIIKGLKYLALKHDWLCINSVILYRHLLNSLCIYIPSFWFLQSEQIDQKGIINKGAQGAVLIHLETAFEKFNFLTKIRKLLGLVEDAIIYSEFPDISQKQARAPFCKYICKVWVGNQDLILMWSYCSYWNGTFSPC